METITNIGITYYTDMLSQLIKMHTGEIVETFDMVQRDKIHLDPRFKFDKVLAYNILFTTASGRSGSLSYSIDTDLFEIGEEVLTWELKIDNIKYMQFSEDEYLLFAPFEMTLLDLFVSHVKRIELLYNHLVKVNEISPDVNKTVKLFLTDFFNQLNNNMVKVIRAEAMYESQPYTFNNESLYGYPSFALVVRTEDNKLLSTMTGLN